MRIVNVVGARPQFIKAAPVSNALRAAGHQEVLVHTGQHYDYAMSQTFFDELGIAEPDVNLGVGSGSHAEQTAQMLVGVERLLLAEQPDCVIVYGDTNTTLAAALASCKVQVPVAHVEAGLRSFNRSMPEEYNRVLVDHAADLLFCPTRAAAAQLEREGIRDGVHVVGDPMYDAVLCFAERARQSSTVLQTLKLDRRNYFLATVHRAYNTDDAERLLSLIATLAELELPVVLPLHPRTRERLTLLNGSSMAASRGSLRLVEPLGYLDMLVLEENARMILTDSGGMQKEAFFFGVPCITLRPETEWTETVETGWNVVVDVDKDRIHQAITGHPWPRTPPPRIFGDGHASERIVEVLESHGHRNA